MAEHEGHPGRRTLTKSELQRLFDYVDDQVAAARSAGRKRWLAALKVSLTGAEHKLAQLDHRTREATTVNLGLPTFHDIAGRSVTTLSDRP